MPLISKSQGDDMQAGGFLRLFFCTKFADTLDLLLGGQPSSEITIIQLIPQWYHNITPIITTQRVLPFSLSMLQLHVPFAELQRGRPSQ